MRFCGSCGGQLSPGAKFCTVCGSPVQPAETPIQAPPRAAASASWEQQAPRGVRRRWPLVLAAGVAVTLVMVGGAVFVALQGGSDGESVGDNGVAAPLVKAVTSEPEEVWDWRVPHQDDYGYATIKVVGDRTLVGYPTDSGSLVTALDDQGDTVWEIEPDHLDWLNAAVPGTDNFLLGPYEDGSGIEARSVKDGSLAWWFEDGNAVAETEAGVLYVVWSDYDEEVTDYTQELGLLDGETGEEIWTDEAEAWQVHGDDLYLTDGEEVRSLDMASGEENWSIGVDVDLDVDYPVLTLAAVKDMVVVGGTDRAVALSSKDGAQLWDQSLGSDESGPYRATSHLVYLEQSTDSEEFEDGEVRFFDSQGVAGSLPVDVDDYSFGSSTFDMGGVSYLIDSNNGLLYDEDLKVLGDYPGYLTPVSPGLYSTDEDELSYYEIGTSSPVWTLRLDGADYGIEVAPADGAVMVHEGDRVVRYE
ncbi:PQQ-binding-like beta-propeller repeat protein [Nocardioides sp.]|uniref:outer membrane protein assembly factor BamB family protein n=1 Tax=Nocardioides sp. TaxID=35761 RepID=UPI003D0F7C3B